MEFSHCSSYSGNISTHHVQQKQHQDQQNALQLQMQRNPMSGVPLSTDEYQQIMRGNIGSVMPSRSSVVSFMGDPDGMISIGNMNAIFDDAHNGSMPQMMMQTSFLQQQMQAQQQTVQNAIFQQHQQMQQPIMKPLQTPSIPLHVVCSLPGSLAVVNGSLLENPMRSVSESPSHFPDQTMSENAASSLFTMPDNLSAPIDDDIFADLHPIPLNKNKRKDSAVTSCTPSPTAPPSSLSLLHQACYLYPTTLAVIQSALGIEKGNVNRRVLNPSETKGQKRQKKENGFTLPLHIAIDNGGTIEVLKALVDADPDVIAMTDGPDQGSAISMALRKSCDLETIKMLIKANPTALKVLDRHKNTCLHVACAKGATLNTIKLLLAIYGRDAISMRNFHGQRALDVAQANTVCPVAVLDLLQEVWEASLEKQAKHLVDSDDDGLI